MSAKDVQEEGQVSGTVIIREADKGRVRVKGKRKKKLTMDFKVGNLGSGHCVLFVSIEWD